jgi:hypothetical protein
VSADRKTAEDTFLFIAAQWFEVDRATVKKWIGYSDKRAGALVENLQSMFVAGYELGVAHAKIEARLSDTGSEKP